LLLDKNDLNRIFLLRRVLQPMNTVESMEFLLEKVQATKNNRDFLDSMNQ
jgi:transcription termination factor Rho